MHMYPTPDKREYLQAAERLIRNTADARAELVALPDLWSCPDLECAYRGNTEPIPGPTTDSLCELARELGIYVPGGSILEGSPDPEEHSTTSTYFGPDGELSAVYRRSTSST